MGAELAGVVMSLQEEVKKLKTQLEGSISKELAMSVLKGAEAELAKAETEVRKVASEILKSRGAIQTLLARIENPKSEHTASKSLIVNYDKPISQLISEAGFSYVNSDITEKHFNKEKTGGTEVLECKMYHFGRNMSSDDVIAEMKRDGFEQASLKALLHYQLAHPDEHKQYPIVGLRNPWRDSYGYRYVPYLYWNDDRKLYLYWCGYDWNGHYRFLAVRRS
ncbi:MAG: hypothetical protein Q7S83_03370 [bacterium]|nr:hypothetical protein [bacterium]